MRASFVLGFALLSVSPLAIGQPLPPRGALRTASAHIVRDINPGGANDDAFMAPPVQIGHFSVGWVGTSRSGYGDVLPWSFDIDTGNAVLLREVSPLYDPRFVDAPFLPLGGRLYFSGFTDYYSSANPPLLRLWSTDGTPAGTFPVSAAEGGGFDYPSALTLFEGKLYYFAATAGNPSEYRLWKTDGTPEGTVSIAGAFGVPPIFIGFEGYVAVGIPEPTMATVGGRLLFFGSSTRDTSKGYALYRLDSSGSVEFLADFSDVPESIIEMNGVGYFPASDGYGVHGNELWRTDGTPEGTRMVKDICAGPCGSTPMSLTVIGHSLYFSAGDGASGPEVWKSDGTEAGTTLVRQVASTPVIPPYGFVGADGQVFFIADDGIHGQELWRTDGTSDGTRLVKDLMPGTDGGQISNLVPLGPWLLFTGDDGVHGNELWRTDGTESGTTLVADIASGSPGSSPQTLTPFGGAIYFSADDGIHGRELWRTDATSEGTVLALDIMPGTGSSNPFLLATPVPPLRFIAVDPLGLSLWEIGGASPGAARMATLGSGVQSLSSNPFDLIDVGGRLCFFTNSNRYGEMSQLWTSDGTEETTQEVQVFEPTSIVESYDFGAVASVAIGEHLFVVGTADLNNVNARLYRLDLDGKHLQPLTDTFPSTQAVLSQTVFFTLNFSELWKAEVGSDHVERVGTFDGAITSLKASQNLLFLSVAHETTFGLWRGDGTESGTAKIWSSSGPALHLTDADGFLYFTSYDDASKKASLWVVSPGAPTAVLVQTFPLDASFGDPFSNLTGARGSLFFLRFNLQSLKHELWRSDGTGPGTVLLTGAEAAPGTLRYDGSQLFFVATTAAEGSELWRSDGTAHGTSLVKDINPGFSDSRPTELAVIDGLLFFSADDGLNGREVWRSDGTPEGTYILQDLCPGACSSDPASFTKSGPWIYFSADDGISGNELWAMPASGSNISRPPLTTVGNPRKPRSLDSR